MMITRRGIVSVASLLLGACVARGKPVSLRVNGPVLRSGDEALTLRGVAVGDPLLVRAQRPVADYDRLAQEWGVNVVRVSVHPGLWRAERKGMLALLDREVRAAADRGLFVIVDWHSIGWPGGEFEKPDPGWGLPPDVFDADLDLAAGFWRTVASRYGADPRVIFEIWNEPVRPRSKERRSAPGEDWARLRPVWMDLTREVRRHGDNLVLATGGGWASDLTGVREALLPDPNTAYAWHVYPSTWRGETVALASLLDDLDKVRPVFVTEWGFAAKPGDFQGTPEAFGRAFAEGFLRDRRLHWSAWCWTPAWDPPLIESDWRTPTAAGAFVMGLLRRPTTLR